jgi:hypothetical protein
MVSTILDLVEHSNIQWHILHMIMNLRLFGFGLFRQGWAHDTTGCEKEYLMMLDQLGMVDMKFDLSIV